MVCVPAPSSPLNVSITSQRRFATARTDLDDYKRIRKFHDDESLNFDLLADEDHVVAEAYGVWVEKSRYGRRYWGNERTTFVIDEDGVIQAILRKVRPKEHDEQVLAALAA